MKNRLIIIIIAVIVLAAGLYIYLRAPRGLVISTDEQLRALNATTTSNGSFNLPAVKWLPNGKPDLSGPIEYKVFWGSADGPTISKIVFAPYDVKPGQTQNFYAIASDKDGVKSLLATVKTDKGPVQIPLSLTQGDAKNGVWQGNWTVKDTSPGYYSATFAVASLNGEIRSTEASFMDSVFSSLFGEIAFASTGESCGGAINVTGTFTLATICNVTSSDAVVNGNVNINSVGTLSIAAGITFGFTNGYSISIASGGSISLGSGAQIVKMGIPLAGGTYNAYVKDRDGDGYWDAQQITTSTPSNYELRTTTGLIGGGDCYDFGTNASSAYPGQTAYFTTARGDGSFDYNCDGVETKNVTSYNYPNSCFVDIGAVCGPTSKDCAPPSCSTLTITSTPACGLTYTQATGCAPTSTTYCSTPCSEIQTNCGPVGLSSPTVACR